MKSYYIICLLKYIDKILKKVVINELLRIYEKKSLLYFRQMGARKNKNVIDTVILLIYKIQRRWKKGEKIVTLFINIKNAFDHVSKKKLAKRITDLDIDKDLID